jgi:GTP cyclohydrolase III
MDIDTDIERNLEESIVNRAGSDSGCAIAYAILKLSESQEKIAYQIQYLGGGNSMSQMGAVEFLAGELRDAMQTISGSIEEATKALERSI